MVKEDMKTKELISMARSLHNAGLSGWEIADIMKIKIGRVHRLISKSYLNERKEVK